MREQGLRALLTGFLAGAGVPVYAAGQVPLGAACPYLTYDLRTAGFGGKGSLAIEIWTMADFAGCAALSDRVMRLLPGGHALLVGPDGAVLLRFERSAMTTAPADRRMTCAQVQLAMYVYGE